MLHFYGINGIAMKYDQAVVELGLPTLAERRESLTIKFGMDTFKNEKHNGFFEEKYRSHQTPDPNTKSKNTLGKQTEASIQPSLTCQRK